MRRFAALACFLATVGLMLAAGMPRSMEARAAQPWTCVCKGQKKRFLASTRHCERRFSIPKGKWCSREQFRKVYGPACAKQGCTLSL